MAEARPDAFIRYDYPKLLELSRSAVANLVHAPTEAIAFVENATEGVNTVLRNLHWNDDGKDVIMNFSTVYGGTGKAEDFIVDYFDGKVSIHEIELSYPIEDDQILALFRDAVDTIKQLGNRPRICIFDVVSSLPGLVFPWVDVVKACRELGVMSLVDGAQGIGQVPLDLSAADPDFFVSNCHKWLHVPRVCSVFYVPIRNQHLLPSTLGTSHGYIPKKRIRKSPLPPNQKSQFHNNFDFVGTRDDAPYLCVVDAIAWRRDVLGGEEKIYKYLWDLNKSGLKQVATILGTEYLENDAGTLTNCAMGNVRLPLWVGEKGLSAGGGDHVVPHDEAMTAFQWMEETLLEEHKTFIACYVRWDRFWARLSAQVYLDEDDYAFAGRALKNVCERVAKGAYKS